jgi:hypothetical protein
MHRARSDRPSQTPALLNYSSAFEQKQCVIKAYSKRHWRQNILIFADDDHDCMMPCRVASGRLFLSTTKKSSGWRNDIKCRLTVQ